MTLSTADQRIRSLRPPKPKVDPYQPHGYTVESERRPGGSLEQTLTVFLAGAECPFTCAFCDLWRFTLDGPTPPGALTHQLRTVFQSTDVSAIDRLKLYNSSNFFDRRAVPEVDFRGIGALSRGFTALTVESHASMVGPSALEFARAMDGRLEVAIGLETIHPLAAARLNKRLDLERFDWAAEFLRENDMDLRVFVLLGAPHVPAVESVEWTVRTVEHAINRGASVVSVIPVRGGNGELERLQALGDFVPPTLTDLEDAVDRCADITAGVVTADLWDVDRLGTCEFCRVGRVERLRRRNLTGVRETRLHCGHCGTA